MISDRHRCIFVHIPKCGGTSIEDVIWPEPRREADLWMGFVDAYHNKYQTGGLQHLTAAQIRTEVGAARFGACWKFAMVRNPFDRAVSQYAFMAKRPDLRAFLGMDEDAPFAAYLERIARRRHVQWTPQHEFLCDAAGALLVDFVGRFETLAEDAAWIFARLGLGAPVLPHANKGERSHYREYYGLAERRAVEALYARDLDLFGYDF